MAARKKAGRKGGARSSARKGGARKKASRGAKKSSSRRPTAKKGGAKKSAARKKSTKRSSSAPKRKSPIQRVTSVAKQVAQQAQAAVVGGVEALREMGGNVAEKVGERMGGSEQV